jgi:hypothetical protein
MASEITQIHEGPGKWDVLLTSLLEGKEIRFGLESRPESQTILRFSFVRLTKVSRAPGIIGFCNEWVIEGVVVSYPSSGVEKGTVFTARYRTDVRKGTAILDTEK